MRVVVAVRQRSSRPGSWFASALRLRIAAASVSSSAFASVSSTDWSSMPRRGRDAEPNRTQKRGKPLFEKPPKLKIRWSWPRWTTSRATPTCGGSRSSAIRRRRRSRRLPRGSPTTRGGTASRCLISRPHTCCGARSTSRAPPLRARRLPRVRAALGPLPLALGKAARSLFTPPRGLAVCDWFHGALPRARDGARARPAARQAPRALLRVEARPLLAHVRRRRRRRRRAREPRNSLLRNAARGGVRARGADARRRVRGRRAGVRHAARVRRGQRRAARRGGPVGARGEQRARGGGARGRGQSVGRSVSQSVAEPADDESWVDAYGKWRARSSAPPRTRRAVAPGAGYAAATVAPPENSPRVRGRDRQNIHGGGATTTAAADHPPAAV